MVKWEAISERALRARIRQGEARMTQLQLRLWDAIRIEPAKWRQIPYGEEGRGFWAVGLIGTTVIWYNDREDGFNRSTFVEYGTIADYWRNQDELETTLQYLLDSLQRGADLVRMVESSGKLRRR